MSVIVFWCPKLSGCLGKGFALGNRGGSVKVSLGYE